MTTADVTDGRMLSSRALRACAVAAAVMLLAGCGGGSGTPPALPSRTAEPSVSATAPSPTKTPPTRTPATRTPPTRTTETATVTQTPAQTPSETPASSPAGAATSDATSTPTWVWWLLGALLLAAVVAIPLLVRARRRRAWRAQLAASEEEVDWFAHVLLLELQQAPSAPEVRGGWGVGEARVAAVEDRLTALAASAPDDAGRARAVELRDAVRLAREQIRAVSASGTADVSRELAAIAAHLAATLGVPPPSTDL